MKELWTAFSYLGILLGVAFTLAVLSERKRSPAVTWAWILTFFLLPYIGPVCYLFVGYHNYKRRNRAKPAPQKKLVGLVSQLEPNLFLERHPDFEAVTLLAENLTGFPPSSLNSATLFEGEEEIYRVLSEAVVGAKHHIHMEYYIFKSNEVGQYFRELLMDKAKEGVKVRLLLDFVGSWSLNHKFIKPMQDVGVEVAFFNALTFKRPWGFHLRNHRKLCIVDGAIGFIGSQNICSDYQHWRLQKKLRWIDNQLKLEGPVVAHMQTIFLEDWEFSTLQRVNGADYFPPPTTTGSAVIQLLPTGPDEHEHTLEKIFMTFIHSAKKRVTLLSPYFVPTNAVSLALEAAIHRNVQVDILLPKQSDDWVVDLAARSWYRDLVSGGANLYLSQSAFNHCKVITVDGIANLLGSANMDERSFRLNFECTAINYDETLTKNLVESFDRSLEDAHLLKMSDLYRLNILERVRDGFFRLLSPLL